MSKVTEYVVNDTKAYSLLASTPTKSTPLLSNSLTFSTNPGMWLELHTGVYAPGTPTSTTYTQAYTNTVINLSGTQWACMLIQDASIYLFALDKVTNGYSFLVTVFCKSLDFDVRRYLHAC